MMLQPAAPPEGSADRAAWRAGRDRVAGVDAPWRPPLISSGVLRRRWSAPRPRRGRPGHRAVPRTLLVLRISAGLGVWNRIVGTDLRRRWRRDRSSSGPPSAHRPSFT